MLDTASTTEDKIQGKEPLETKKVPLQIKSNNNFKIKWESQGNSQKTEQKDRARDERKIRKSEDQYRKPNMQLMGFPGKEKDERYRGENSRNCYIKVSRTEGHGSPETKDTASTHFN